MKTWLQQRGDWVDSNYVRPPVLSIASGVVPSGQTVNLTAPSGTIYRTLDGSDPRLPGGAVAATAATGNTVMISADTKVTARVQGSPSWSAQTVGVYVPDAVAATAGNLAVSEIHYHPGAVSAAELTAGFTNPDDFEFVEVLNFSTQKVSLAGARFAGTSDGGGIAFAFNDGGIWSLATGARAVIVKNRAAFTLRYGSAIPVAGEYSGRLDNEGDTVTLLSAAGPVIAAITYNDKAPWAAADGDGYSLTLRAPGGTAGDPASWRSSVAAGGSPGTGDGVPFSSGDLLTYAFGGHAPSWTFSDGSVLVSQQCVPGSDAAIVSLESSPDLTAWTTAAPGSTEEVRAADGGVVIRWTLPAPLRSFFRVRATLR
jgi:hypothetical protein